MGNTDFEQKRARLIAEANALEERVVQFAEHLRETVGLDQRREIALGLTHTEDAFMRLRRAIAKDSPAPNNQTKVQP